ncbi:MAG: hypothetical protein AB7V07_00715 [Candidatus Delongbacteria bacterium]
MKFSVKLFFLLLTLISASFASDPVNYIFSGEKYFTEDILLSEIDPALSAEQNIEVLLDLYVNKGFPFASVKVDSLHNYEGVKSIFLSVNAGNYVRTDDIIFSGADVTSKESLKKLTGLKSGERFSERSVLRAADWIYSSRLFVKRPDFSIVSLPSGNFGVKFCVTEKKYNEIMFIGGYHSSDKEGSTYSVNSVLNADNLFGTMRKLRILWEREGEDAEKLRLYYKEPFLAGIRLSTEVEYGQVFRKELYLKRSFMISQKYSYDPLSGITYGIEKEYFFSEIPEITGEGETVVTRYSTGIEYGDTDNGILIPEDTGLSFSAGLSSVNIEKPGMSDRNGIEIIISPDMNIKFTKNIFLGISSEYDHMIFDESVPEYARITFGGADSFRGYREDAFISDIYILNTADLYLVENSGSVAIDIFTDVCSYNGKNDNIDKIRDLETLLSFGIGIIYATQSGQISLHAAIPQSEGFSEAVVHAMYSFRF